MNQDHLPFNVTGLDVTMNEGVKFQWQGREIESGPLTITLGEPGSHGVINYETGCVDVEFRVKIQFPELAEILTDMGAEPGLSAPVDAVVRSQGSVLDGHALRLAGKAKLAEHQLFTEDTQIEILAPTRCRPDAVCKSAEEIREALRNNEPVQWNFNPTEKRVVLTLPEALGGQSHVLCLAGSYTFTAACPQEAVA